jgi:murein peptide amidase A
MNIEFQRHRVHSYENLMRRWKRVSRRAHLRWLGFARAGDFEVVCLKSSSLESSGGIYLSAGIHGDEPASTEGLCLWAELHASTLRQLPVIIFPCLNPWGLIHNQRNDEQGRDLNRCYHLDEPETIRAQKELIRSYTFRLGMCLHEDYDAQGVYCYEIKRPRSALGPELLAAAGFYIPVDLRRTIEGRRAVQGWIARRYISSKFPFKAESMYLAENHSNRNVTFETPSEYDLVARIHAQVAAIQRAMELIGQLSSEQAPVSGGGAA